MKRRLMMYLGIGLIMLSFSVKTTAQEEQTLPPVTVTATTNINKAVSESFKKTFKDATNAQWYKVNKNYLVDFISKDQQNRALLEKNGAIIYHITYGYENNIPEDIRKMVKTNYVDYNITKAINVQQQQRNIWVINVESDKKLILVRVEDGELEEVGNYNKSM